MDERTKQKHLRACRIMLHIFEGHARMRKLGRIQTLVSEGIVAAQALGMEAILREEAAERIQLQTQIHEAKVLAESLRMDRDAARAEARRAKTAAPVVAQICDATPVAAQDPPKMRDKAAPVTKEKRCAYCGKPFMSRYQTAAYCSHECRLASNREQMAAHRAKKAAAALAATVASTAPASAVTADAVTDDGMHYCERMRLRSSSPLPCGKRMECVSGTRCKRCPEDAAPVPPPVVPDTWGIGRSLPAGDL